MTPNPTPDPYVWPPHSRFSARLATWIDQHNARHNARIAQQAVDTRWRHDYEAWFMEHGWLEGADIPDVAYRKVQLARRASLTRAVQTDA